MNKISKKIINLLVIICMMILNVFCHANVLAIAPEKGNIKDATISVGSLNEQGDVQVTKTVTKTDNVGEYKITFNIKGNPVTKTMNKNLDSYTVFVLDASKSMDNNSKWTKAKEAAIQFSNTLVTNSSNNYIALVTFNSKGYKLRDFENKKFDNNIFGNTSVGTDYFEGLSVAKQYIDEINNQNSTTEKVFNIVFISDGEPRGKDYSSVLQEFKDKGVNIYTLAYDLKTDSTAYNKLKAISTNNTVYEVSTDDISGQLSKVATEILKQNAGSKAVLTDIIGDNFKYVSGDGIVDNNTVSYDIGDITETGKELSFIIKINEDVDTGWYPTNEGFILTYLDSNDQKQTLKTDKSSSVYWIENKVNFTVNFYNESTNTEKLGSISNELKKGTTIFSSEIDTTPYQTIGYKLLSIIPSSITINEDTSLDIIFTKINDLSYIVNYYIDNIFNKSVVKENIEYGTLPTFDELEIPGYSKCSVTNDTNPIVDNTTEVNVYYCKNDYNYKVRYYYDTKLTDEITYSGKYNDIVDTYEEKIIDGYELDKVENLGLTISENEEDNIINVYYKLKDVEYTINYLDSNNNKIAKSKVKSSKFFDTVTEEAKEFKNYKLNDDKLKSIELDEENKQINFYYEKKHGSVIVKYVDELGNTISDDTVITGEYGENYSVSVKDIDNYTFTQNQEYIEGTIEDDEKVVTLVYNQERIEKVSSPLTGISNNKYASIFISSLIGIVTLIVSKMIFKMKK